MPPWLLIMFQVFSVLPGLITSAETAFSKTRGSGAAKREVVLKAVETGLDVAGQVTADLTPPRKAAILEAVGDLTDATVSVMNSVNAFREPQQA